MQKNMMKGKLVHVVSLCAHKNTTQAKLGACRFHVRAKEYDEREIGSCRFCVRAREYDGRDIGSCCSRFHVHA
jgi:hypothetical protein